MSSVAPSTADQSRIVIAKFSALAIVFYLGYLAVTCPCKRLWACHEGKVWLAIAVLVLLMCVENGLPHALVGGSASCSAGGK
ncbi:hypothetical protein [Medusavirus stheno T3]|uniref:Uncharacterized protein n=1 Tax=Medusavirus stheno T3 TaxID=3069717 RepID=A0A7S8BDJ0_9VIRU|nr:hypothetical protein QKU73_gp073 [Acanthamoeba castellanii medusavirus]QPB44254.1 hypothetical protein [Medusavirus stheno T3]